MGNRYSDLYRELKFLHCIGTETGLIILMNQHKEDELTNFLVYWNNYNPGKTLDKCCSRFSPVLGRSFLFESDGTWASFLSRLVGC